MPAIPAAAYRASMPPPGISPGAAIGVSGGGGDPLCALVVDVEADELSRLTPGLGICKPSAGVVLLDELSPGGGQYCW